MSGGPAPEDLLRLLDQCDLSNSRHTTPSVSPSPSMLSTHHTPKQNRRHAALAHTDSNPSASNGAAATGSGSVKPGVPARPQLVSGAAGGQSVRRKSSSTSSCSSVPASPQLAHKHTSSHRSFDALDSGQQEAAAGSEERKSGFVRASTSSSSRHLRQNRSFDSLDPRSEPLFTPITSPEVTQVTQVTEQPIQQPTALMSTPASTPTKETPKAEASSSSSSSSSNTKGLEPREARVLEGKDPRMRRF